MPLLTSTLDAEFTPAASPFRVQVAGGAVRVESRAVAGSGVYGWITTINDGDVRYIDNPVAGVGYRIAAASGSPTFRADQ